MGFKIGDLVWAKMKGFPPWPARITAPIATAKVPKNKKAHQFVLFFGTNDGAWVLEENIMPHSQSILDALGKKKNKSHQHAIDELLKYSGTKTVEKQSPKAKEKVESGKQTIRVVKISESVSKKHERNVLGHKSPIKNVPKKRRIDEGDEKYSVKSPPKSSKRHALDNVSIDESLVKSTDSNRYSLERHQSLENLPGCSKDSKKVSVASKRQSDLVDAVSEDFETTKKFGFIGLGEFGRAILTRFIDCGMDVTLWHKDSDHQYWELAEIKKAKLADSPAHLVLCCDIIFSCYDTDSDTFKDIIFGQNGILEGFEEAEKSNQRDKGYVGLNSIDYETSKEINEAITIKNGYYLEAPIINTGKNNNEDEFIVVASGNRQLYTYCEKYFNAIAEEVMFLSCEIGASSKMSVVLDAAAGTILAAMSEAMVLSSRLNLKKDDVHQIFKYVLLGDTLGKKVRKMSEQDYTRMTPLRHVQKDINFALNLANDVSQSMPVTSAANEVLKHARLLKFSDCDISAIYKVIKKF